MPCQSLPYKRIERIAQQGREFFDRITLLRKRIGEGMQLGRKTAGLGDVRLRMDHGVAVRRLYLRRVNDKVRNRLLLHVGP